MTSPHEMVESALDPSELRRTFSCFPSGVTALCTLIDGLPVGMAASSFCSVSLDPPLVLVCVAQTSATWLRLRMASRLGISVLSRGHDNIVRQLAGPAAARFDGVAWTTTEAGAVLLERSAAWLECELEQEVEAGDHHIAVLGVRAAMRARESEPLVFHESRFRAFAGPAGDGPT
jgi:flavin reductase (DIM6/NTAB) family NADH-FMN oxidoreductase RutF